MQRTPNHPRPRRAPSAHAAALASLVAMILAAAPAGAAPLRAEAPLAVAMNLDFLWTPDARNDTQVFLHVSNMAWQPPREQVRVVYPLLPNPESDFPVLLFIATEARVSLSAVWTLRAKGLPWTQVMLRLGVPPERVFVEMSRDPGPPYGKAYGHWKKHPRERVVVTDDDILYWVNVRAMSRYFGVEPVTVADWRESGRTWKVVAAGEYRTRKGRRMDKAGVAGAEDEHGDDNGHPSKGKGKSGKN